jgi:hypothetical protein
LKGEHQYAAKLVTAPGVVLGQLGAAAAFGALEGFQFMAAAAALTEALPGAVLDKAGRLYVDVADAALLVVCAQTRKVPRAALHLLSHQIDREDLTTDAARSRGLQQNHELPGGQEGNDST